MLEQQNKTSESASGGKTGGGCYLTVMAPPDFEITSSFPIVGSSSVRRTEYKDPFQWVPHNDNWNGIRYSNENGNDAIVNRGYQARTSRCFGYSSSNRAWYNWDSESNMKGNDLQKVTLPNDEQYGYDNYLDPQDAYDRTLSMSPAGMIENRWPLPVRVKSSLALGLEFTMNDSNDQSNTVLQVDSSGKELDGSKARFEFKPKSVSDAMSIDTYLKEESMGNDIQAYTDEYSTSSGNDQQQSNNTSTNYRHSNVHGILTDTRVLDDVLESFLGEKVLEQSPLGTANDKQAEQVMEYVNVVIRNQWSLVDVADRSSDGLAFSMQKKRSHIESERIVGVSGDSRRMLQGIPVSSTLANAPVSHSDNPHTTFSDHDSIVSISVGSHRNNGNRHLLRGRASNKNQGQRQHRQSHPYLRQRQQTSTAASTEFSYLSSRDLVAIPQPHLIFILQIYGKYDESALLPSFSSNPDDPKISSRLKMAEKAAMQTTADFAPRLSDTVNGYRDQLTMLLRQRSGYGQECNPITTNSNGASNPLSGFTPISIRDENSLTEEEYTEIEIGVVNRFDCDKLLPLYYYELSTLAVRTVDDNGGNTDQREKAVLNSAISSLKVDDGIYGRPTTIAETPGNSDSSNGSMSTWLVVTVAFVCALVILAIVGGLYIKRERKKLREEKERRRLLKEQKLKLKQEGKKIKKKKKKKATDADDESLDDVGETAKSKKMTAKDRKRSLGYDTDDSELDRLYADNGGEGGDGDGDEPSESAGGSTLISTSHRTGGSESSRAITKTKSKRHRKKKGTTSESDSNHTASNASGLNYSLNGASKENESTTVGSTTKSKTNGDSKENDDEQDKR